MRRVHVRHPSFPEVESNQLLSPAAQAVWQVLCGDRGHWRAGIYSPSAARAEDLEELERHTCPELFLLLGGRVRLVLFDADAPEGRRELELEAGRPVLVSAPHNGYCPDGPHKGTAFVVERDEFATEYRSSGEWLRSGTITLPPI